MLLDEERLERLEKTASSLLKRREELNRQAERWRNEQDSLNESVKSMRTRAMNEKGRRDQLNQMVADVRKRIDELSRELDAKPSRLYQLDEELGEGRGKLPPRHELEQRLRRVEWEVSTTPTLEMQEKEDSLAERTRALKRALEEHDKLDAQYGNRLESLADTKAVELEIRTCRDEMKQLRERGHEHHGRMVQLFREADEERKRAEIAHNSFLESISAIKEVNDRLDRVMEEVRELRHTIRERDQLAATEKQRDIEERKQKLASEAKRRLEAGEKLSIEELKLIYEKEEE